MIHAKIAWFKIPDTEFLGEISETGSALDIHFNLGVYFNYDEHVPMYIKKKKKNESNNLTHKDRNDRWFLKHKKFNIKDIYQDI